MASPDSPPPYEHHGPLPPQHRLLPSPTLTRKPVPASIRKDARMQDSTAALPVQINLPSAQVSHQSESALIESVGEIHLNDVPLEAPYSPVGYSSPTGSPVMAPAPRELHVPAPRLAESVQQESFNEHVTPEPIAEVQPQLQYHHQPFQPPSPLAHATARSSISDTPPSSNSGEATTHTGNHLTPLGFGVAGASRTSLGRPTSAYSSLSDISRDRGSPNHLRAISANSGRSPDGRPLSYANMLNLPYVQAAPDASNFKNQHLKVGTNAALQSHKKTLEAYRMNAKKTNDPEIQYQLALFMVASAQESESNSPQVDGGSNGTTKVELIKEARNILRNLSDRGYPFAQYYLADGYASGLFSSKQKVDWDRALPLFLSAAKHGHAESAYRVALCHEFGWGCRRDPAKAGQFYRHAASKNHPGAMTRYGKACLLGDFGLENKHRQGLKWLRLASESADRQYNSAPYELGLLHEKGFYDYIIPDEQYTTQLYTQAADLGHAEAAYRLGDSYEHGKLTCPKDPGLSIHFYTEAAQQGHAPAQLALCAWYLIGAEPILQKDENEAYEWALKAAGNGLPKAEYAIGFFTETGIGCRPDTLEANVWYVRAADQGEERAINRLANIQAAASGEQAPSANSPKSRIRRGATPRPAETLTRDPANKDKDCVIM
ncbi:MAG: hypothetical protein M1814_006737 [Vezdaea aestivalis]|nr:MAG: hypothetical protein M1814_006737 [Vezdaea aestivalis]